MIVIKRSLTLTIPLQSMDRSQTRYWFKPQIIFSGGLLCDTDGDTVQVVLSERLYA